MAVAQHRAPTAYAVPTPWAAALAVGIGLVAGVGIALAVAPGPSAFATGITYGLILGIPAAVAVVFARRAVEQGATSWMVGLIGLGGVVVVAALLFALTQLDVGMAPVGAALGIATGILSLVAGLSLARHRREGEQDVMPRRH